MAALLDDIHHNMYAMAKANLDANTFQAETWEEVKETLEGPQRSARLSCELAMKDKVGVSSRCMPLEQSPHHRQVPGVRQGVRHRHHLGRGLLIPAA